MLENRPNNGGLESQEERPLLQDWRIEQSDRADSEEIHRERQSAAGGEVLKSAQLWGVYLSHFLSTWNSRCYEFAAILFTASAFPGTLLASSIRGLLANLSTLVLSPAVGRWADGHPSRLRALQTTILLQRLCIGFASVGWTFMVNEDAIGGSFGRHVGHNFLSEGWTGKFAVMAILQVLDMGERLSAVGNMLIMERDWVPTLATPTSRPPLHVLNASMRRIDLISKLIAPIFISFAAILLGNLGRMALVLAGMNAIFMIPEWLAAARVWSSCSMLREPRPVATAAGVDGTEDTMVDRNQMNGFNVYFGSDAWIPSLSLALQSFPVLSLSASMTTYILNVHYTLRLLTIARIFSSVIEVSSTILMPWLVSRLTTPNADPRDPPSRVGLWGLSWQVITLLPVTMSLLLLPTSSLTPASSHPALSVTLFVFLALSRLGFWTYSLAAETVVQILVPASQRVEFSGIEMGFVSAAEVARWSVTAVWARPEQFGGIAATGMAVVAGCLCLYSMWIWRS